MQFTLHSYTKIEKINLFHNIRRCAIVSMNTETQQYLLTRLRRSRRFWEFDSQIARPQFLINISVSVPRATFKCISFYTDIDIQRKKIENFNILIHFGLPESFKIFKDRFAIASGLGMSFILIENGEESLPTEQKQILVNLRNRSLLRDPNRKEVSIFMIIFLFLCRIFLNKNEFFSYWLGIHAIAFKRKISKSKSSLY